MGIRKKMVRFGHLMAAIIDGPGTVGDVLEEMAVRLMATHQDKKATPPRMEPVTRRNWMDLVNLVRDEMTVVTTAMTTGPVNEQLAPGARTTLWDALTRTAAACLAAAIDLGLVDDDDFEKIAAELSRPDGMTYRNPYGPPFLTSPWFQDFYKVKCEEEAGRREMLEAEAAALRRANNELESERNAARETIQRLEGDLEAHQAAMEAGVYGYRKLEGEITAERDEAVAASHRFIADLAELKTDLIKARHDVGVATADQSRTNTTNAVLRTTLANVERERDDLKCSLEASVGEIRAARQRRNELWKLVQELGELMRTGVGLTRESQPKGRFQ